MCAWEKHGQATTVLHSLALGVQQSLGLQWDDGQWAWGGRRMTLHGARLVACFGPAELLGSNERWPW